MSVNVRVLPTRLIARSRIRRDRDKVPILPRIIERKPRRGDSHPLPGSMLRALLRYQRIDYLYGLSRIELRPRESKVIGGPFGFYSRREKFIVLYSVPADEWKTEGMARWVRESAVRYGATLRGEGPCPDIVWGQTRALAKFMYCEVFLHELGHHHDHQYRHKHRPPRGRRSSEISAEQHSSRLNRLRGLPLWRYLVEEGQLPPDDPA